MVITDPRADHQPVTEASYANIPVVAFCNVDSPTKYIDLCIPCNNKGDKSIGLMWWFLAREVLRLRGVISRELPWEVMPDLFFYRYVSSTLPNVPTSFGWKPEKSRKIRTLTNLFDDFDISILVFVKSETKTYWDIQHISYRHAP